MTKKRTVQVSGLLLIMVALLLVVAVQAFAAPTETAVTQTDASEPDPVDSTTDSDEEFEDDYDPMGLAAAVIGVDVDVLWEAIENGRSGLTLALEENPDLIVLDLMLPGLDGRVLCQEVRRHSEVPIIMLTARDGQQDRIASLDMGADDYVVKPFDPEELVARARAVLRRVSGTVAEQLTVGDFTIQLDTNTCTVRGTAVSLSPTQFALLTAFLRHPNQILSREQLLDAAFHNDFDGFDRTIDAHIRRLRRQIEPDPSQPQYILTVYGLGYKFMT